MTEARFRVAPKMRPFMAEQRRHKVARGGRGSAKSWSIARMLVAKGVQGRQRWLCCREVQKSIKESSHKLLSNQIDAMKLNGLYDVQRDSIKGPNGTEFLFAGLQDHTADSIKSYEELDGAWVEEAHTVSERSANILIPTVRNPGSEIWWSYNPDQGDDFVHKMAERKDAHVLVVDINWRDNPWFPAELEIERQRMKDLNTDLYEHIWEGKLRSAAGVLFKRHWFKFYDSLPDRLTHYMAGDYAGAPDPDKPESDPDFTEFGDWGLDETGSLYAADWWFGQEDPEVWINAGANMARRHKPKIWYEEKGVLLRALDSAITKRLRELQTFVYRHPLASAGSKAERALGFAARASAGAVYFPRTEWAERVINQLCAFTGQAGRRDDAVDVCSLVARGLDTMSQPSEKKDDRPKSVVPFSKQHIEAAEMDEREQQARKQRYYR